MTDIEKELYSLSGCKVKITCSKYDDFEGEIEKFWTDSYCPDKINFILKKDGKEIVHGFEMPTDYKKDDNKWTFETQGIEYTFEVI